MAGFDPGSSGNGSDRSANCVTTIALDLRNLFQPFLTLSMSALGLIQAKHSGLRILKWTVALMQRDRKFSIDAVHCGIHTRVNEPLLYFE